MRVRGPVLVVGLLACAVAAPAAAGQGSNGGSERSDYAQTALNVLPSGQYGDVPPPPEATDQADLYDGLTPLFDHHPVDRRALPRIRAGTRLPAAARAGELPRLL